MPDPADRSDAAPRRLGDYELLEAVGAGRGGTVYRARHVPDGAPAAVTVVGEGVDLPPAEVDDIIHAAHTAGRLEHPRIVQRRAFGRTPEGRPWFASDWVEGATLAAKLADGPLAPEEALSIGESLARTLADAHEAGYVHLHLSPAKIHIDADGEPWIRGFGFAADARRQRARSAAPPMDATNRYAYLSPEQVQERHSVVGRTSDIYALGAVLYAMLTGRPPHLAPSWEDLDQAVTRDDPALPSARNEAVDPAADTVVLRCLEKGRLWRYQDAAALADDIARLRRGEAPAPLQRTLRDRLDRWMEERERLIRRACSAAGVLLLLGTPSLLIGVDFGREEVRPPPPDKSWQEELDERFGPRGERRLGFEPLEILPPRPPEDKVRNPLKEPIPNESDPDDAGALALEQEVEAALASGRLRWTPVVETDFDDGKLPPGFRILFCRADILNTPRRTVLPLSREQAKRLVHIGDSRLIVSGAAKEEDGYTALHYARPIGEHIRIEVEGEEVGGHGPSFTLGGDGFTGRRIVFSYWHQYVDIDTIGLPGGKHEILRRMPVTYPREPDRYRIAVERVGRLIRVFYGGERILAWRDPDPPAGPMAKTCALHVYMVKFQLDSLRILRGER